jgi:hypothetical protein
MMWYEQCKIKVVKAPETPVPAGYVNIRTCNWKYHNETKPNYMPLHLIPLRVLKVDVTVHGLNHGEFRVSYVEYAVYHMLPNTVSTLLHTWYGTSVSINLLKIVLHGNRACIHILCQGDSGRFKAGYV